MPTYCTVCYFDVKRIEFTEEVSKQINELDARIKALEKETVLLHTLPKKLSTQLGEVIPSIAAELNRLNQDEVGVLKNILKSNVEEQNNVIKDSVLRLKQWKEELENIDGKSIKRYCLGFGIGLFVSVLASLGATYIMLKQFPQKIQIESPENVTVQNSDVGLWGSKNLQIKGNVKDHRR